mgnify:FL=1
MDYIYGFSCKLQITIIERGSEMRFDDVLDQIGGFGKYQKIQFILAALPAAVIALHQLASVFLAATPDYK